MVKLNNKFELQNLSGLKHTLTNIEITKFLQENFVGSATDVTKSFECMLRNERWKVNRTSSMPSLFSICLRISFNNSVWNSPVTHCSWHFPPLTPRIMLCSTTAVFFFETVLNWSCSNFKLLIWVYHSYILLEEI